MFQRIWPTNSTHHYFKYFESLPYPEKLMGKSSNLNNRENHFVSFQIPLSVCTATTEEGGKRFSLIVVKGISIFNS